jgi:hypothetical protein
MSIPSSFVRFATVVGLVHLLLATVPHYAHAGGGDLAAGRPVGWWW